MRLRSRILLTAGVACLSTAMLAGGALAHGGDGHKSKFGKFSKHGHASLKVEVRGAITALDTASITVSAAQTAPAAPVAPADGAILTAAPVLPDPGLTWTCNIPAGSTVTGFVVGDVVKLTCKSSDGSLVATRLKAAGKHFSKVQMDHGHRGGRSFGVEVEARGAVSAITPESITVDPGTAGVADTLPNVTCAIGKRTRSFGTISIGDIVKIECKSKNGVLVAKKIKQKGPARIGQIQVEVKSKVATIDAAGIGFEGGVQCAVADATLLTGIVVGDFVEAKCTGNPLTLKKIHLEDDDH